MSGTGMAGMDGILMVGMGGIGGKSGSETTSGGLPDGPGPSSRDTQGTSKFFSGKKS